LADTAVYLSTQKRARLAVLCFRASMAVSALLVLVTLWQFNLWGRIGAAAEVSLAEAEFSDGISMALAFLDLAVLVGTGIAFLMWFHRVRTNLPALGIADARWSPGWAVGWWFVPVMSMFRPYQVAAEIWRASDPAATPSDWRSRSVDPLLGWWWGLFVASTIGGQISFRLWNQVDENSAAGFMQNLALIDAGTAAINFAGALLAIRVVREIDRRQAERSQLMAFV
jgi:hypothetical protein